MAGVRLWRHEHHACMHVCKCNSLYDSMLFYIKDLFHLVWHKNLASYPLYFHHFFCN
ncbi:hypothetical protein CIPAW_08G018900 [Carya illinoinensis]|uniref:Uncharacterized protein n=1 Tax=Carya illinoinensis TaxID=32201 RepID=A0A8T1PQB2_CARIL|nr:hypothetical protein CIPAW_08G018900 [Carya illinoinensis]